MLRQPRGCSGRHAGAALIPGLSLGCGAPSWDPGRTPPCVRVSGTASAGSSRGACDVRLAAVTLSRETCLQASVSPDTPAGALPGGARTFSAEMFWSHPFGSPSQRELGFLKLKN